ncbi:Zn-dependent exopeptidase [Myriangium duriaei CBS 260.36]|uniref:Peptide hydrolase n=1 Tax=Myriangium duriaei CBS 260.36 TaxID=1168546 RepID=A0A9P4MN78_9PEZI|nr:Zn-dependent exopeptidase [Myriangium duriaei CBS 260.36]
MKATAIALTALACAASALSLALPQPAQQANSLASNNGKVLIELDLGEQRWVNEDEKWELRRQGKKFFDITHTQDFNATPQSLLAVEFPPQTAYGSAIKPLLSKLDKGPMQTNLQKLSSFKNRYYKSTTGAQSSNWLLGVVNKTLADAGALKATAKPFVHSWGQNSIIATLPGKSAKTIVIGAHQDSINLRDPMSGTAPGADDDGSGTVTILEALRVILTDDKIKHGEQENTLEFHWYSAEEGGLLGSQAIFSSYQKAGRDVKAMLQQDMTGSVEGTLAAGKTESVGVITDYVDAGLTGFIKKVVSSYCTIPFVETKCGYACSDHASASKAGYPSAFVIESAFEYTSQRLHTANDKIDYVNFDHMIQHARMTLGLAYELAMAQFN